MMSKAHKFYTREMSRRFGYFAAWTPGTPIALGDIGILEGDLFIRLSDLTNEGLDFSIVPDETPEDISFSTSTGVKVSAHAAGTLKPEGSMLAQADAGFTLEFGKQQGIVFKATGVRVNSIGNQLSLGGEILKRFDAGKWKKEWCVVTEVMEAESGTVVYSGESEGKLEIKANADLGGRIPDLADANADLSINWSQNIEANIIAQKGLTPLFRLRKVKGFLNINPKFKGLTRDLASSQDEKAMKNAGIEFAEFAEIVPGGIQE